MNDIRKWQCILFWGLLTALYSHWTWTPQLNDFGGDSAVYLLTAQHWTYPGSTNPAAAQFASATSFPPLYPFLLSLFSAGGALLLAHQITVLCAVGALFLLWRYLRASDFPLIDSLVAVALIAITPGVYSQALYIQSEFLFLLFVCLCLYAVTRLEREKSFVFVVAASLAAACACLTRSIGVALVVALVVYAVLRRPKRECAVVLILAVVPVWLWTHLGQPSGGGYPAAWKERLGLIEQTGVVEIVVAQIAALVDGYQQNLVGQDSTNTAVVALFSIICIAAWGLRLWQRKIDALFLGAYFAILLVWPFPAERVRFLLPAVPILIAQSLLALHGLKFNLLNRSSLNPLLAVRILLLIVAIMILPTLVLTTQRHFDSMPPELEGFRQSPEWYGTGSRDERLTAIFVLQRLQAGFEELRTRVPPDDCIYSIKPALVGLFAQRISHRSPLPNSSLGLRLDRTAVECRYVHISPLVSPTFPEPYYPMGSWADGMDTIHVTRLIESNANSGVATMLTRIR